MLRLILFFSTVIVSDNFFALENQIQILNQKIENYQRDFPQGDLNNKQYIQHILHLMCEMDQEIRLLYIKNCNNTDKNMKTIALLKKIDRFHTIKIKEILLIHKWPNISKFGNKSDHEAWLLVQHADEDPFFQAGCLFILESLLKIGETNKKNYAYLYDRVALKFGLKQRYGTQCTIEETKGITLSPYEGTLEEVAEKRKELALEPLQEYLYKLKNTYEGKEIN